MSSNHTTQNKQVLEHLQEQGTLTSLEAIERYGITRLGARIYDLKNDGWEIETSLITVPTRNGKTKVAQYKLKEPQQVSNSSIGGPRNVSTALAALAVEAEIDPISFSERILAAIEKVTR